MSTEETVVTGGPVMEGTFMTSLKRNNKKIREDRAEAIAESAEMIFKRTVEDITIKIKQLKREREQMLDMSPTTADSLILAEDFDAVAFTAKDIALGIRIREEEIKLEIAQTRYETLFGKL